MKIGHSCPIFNYRGKVMDLKNKKVGFLGDSITYGVGTSNSENNYVGYRFPDLFAKLAGAEAFNYGVSGTRIARQSVPIPGEPSEGHYILRVDKMEADLDFVVVFGGTNDFGHGDAPLGNFTDRGDDTFYGALHALMLKLINKYPRATIVFLTPLHRRGEETLINSFGLRREPLIKYINAIREVAEYYSLPVLDLYKNSGLQPSVDVIRELYMPDGLHPSDLGAQKIANMLYSFLKTI